MRQNVSGLVCLKICLFFSHIWIIICSTCISLKPDKSTGSAARLSVFESLYLLTSCVTLGNLFNIFLSSLPSLKNKGYTKYPLHQVDKKIKRGNSFKKNQSKACTKYAIYHYYLMTLCIRIVDANSVSCYFISNLFKIFHSERFQDFSLGAQKFYEVSSRCESFILPKYIALAPGNPFDLRSYVSSGLEICQQSIL